MHGKPVGDIKEDPVTGWVYEDTSTGLSIIDLAELDPDTAESTDVAGSAPNSGMEPYSYPPDYPPYHHHHPAGYGQQSGRWSGYDGGVAMMRSRAPTPSYVGPAGNTTTPAMMGPTSVGNDQTIPTFYPSWHAQARQQHRVPQNSYANRYQAYQYGGASMYKGGYNAGSRTSSAYTARTPYASSHHGGMSGSIPHGYGARGQMDGYGYTSAGWCPPVPVSSFFFVC